jgi:hypothetical protein
MHHRPLTALAFALLACASLTAPAGAAGERPSGWQTWTWEGSCYAIVYAEPGESAPGVPNGSERAYIAVKHVPKEKTYDGVTIASGLNVSPGTEGMVEVGGQEYPLLVFRGAGFVRSGEPEKGLVDGLSKATEVRVTWTLKDQMTVQTYKVAGFANAHKVIDAACPRSTPPEAAAAVEETRPAPKKTGRGSRG